MQVFLKQLWNENFANIPCISLRTRLCWLRIAGNSVICILFSDLVHLFTSSSHLDYCLAETGHYTFELIKTGQRLQGSSAFIQIM